MHTWTHDPTRSLRIARLTLAVGALLLTALFLSSHAQAQSTNAVGAGPGQSVRAVQDAPDGPSYAEGEILIKFKPGAADQLVADVVSRAAVTRARHILTPAMSRHGDIGIARATTSLPVPQAVQALQNHPAVEYAQPNWIYHHQGGATPPSTFDDTYFRSGALWGVYDGTHTDTVSSYGSGAVGAWIAGFAGSDQVCVGVIDQGIDYTHPDLAANIWTNPGEIAGNGVDDDDNGYIDDVHGWNAISGNGNIYDPAYDTHGTHVAGTIGASGANGFGVSGINWNVSIISGKFLGPDGSGSTADAIEAIDYMTDLKVDGVNIVALNNSWGGGSYDALLLQAIKRAADAGILCVAAAGNGSVSGRAINTDRTPFYPACYNTLTAGASYDSVISVTAIDRAGAKASWANYGRTTVDLGAPGVDIYSTLPGGSYGSYNGTSMATPHVTGAIALYASAYPNATAAAIRQALLGSVTPTTSLASITATGGRLTVASFLGQPDLPVLAVPDEPTDLSASAVSSSQIDVKWSDNSNNETGFRIERSGGGNTWSVIVGADRTSHSDEDLEAGTTYTYSISAYNAVGETAAVDDVEATTGASTSIPGTARYMGKDTTTKGNWIGKYGTLGYHIIGDGVSLPESLTLKTQYESTWGWAQFSTSTSDVRALQSALDPSARGAWCWYSSGYFTVDLNFADQDVRRLALYCVDWETTTRAQTIEVIDAVTKNVLGSQNLSSFNGGQYLIWEVSGHVQLKFTCTGGKNAVLSAFFLDEPVVLPDPPVAPTGLTATSVSRSQINLTWTDNSNNETGFKIERATSSSGPFQVIATAGANATSYSSTGLARNTTYYYRVCATNDGGVSGYSNTASAKTLFR